jgi:hypothetical protein
MKRRLCIVLLAALNLSAQTARHITSPKEEFGFATGDDYRLVNYTRLEAYWKKLVSGIRPDQALRYRDDGGGAASMDGHHFLAGKPEEPGPL